MPKAPVAVVEAPAQPPAPVSEAAAILQIIERAARDPTVDLTKLERLMEMRERMEERIAERDYDAAMADAQALMRPILKDASNPQTRSRYASYAGLDRAVRPIYTDHGFSLSFNTGVSAPGELLVLCRVAHRGGHSRLHQFPVPADGKGAKGGDVMTKTHAAGSAATYGQRYILKQIFNLAETSKEDDDGNAAGGNGGGEPINDAELTNLQIMAEEVEANVPKLCQLLGIPSLRELPKSRYDEVVEALQIKAKRRAEKREQE